MVSLRRKTGPGPGSHGRGRQPEAGCKDRHNSKLGRRTYRLRVICANREAITALASVNNKMNTRLHVCPEACALDKHKGDPLGTEPPLGLCNARAAMQRRSFVRLALKM